MEDHREQKLFAIINPNNETKNTTPTNPGLSSTNDATPCRGTIINNDDDNGSDAFVGTVTNNSQIVPVHHEDDSYYFNSFPPGYKFKPFDRELVVFYLQKKILHEPLPPNRIREVILYNYNPEELADYFFPCNIYFGIHKSMVGLRN
ncbi:conserved hypothetical protein [Ricinus communis]|uniref:NAC domain-containing protein n=1 Tax=Ricinus communis TaxID=3988 RepID=B9T7U9_RICCO|nr:conserved hypothetical protein [Ricinus communis]